MLDNKEQFIAAAKENFESQLDAIISLTHAGFDGFAKIIDLNVGAIQSAFAESAVAMKQLQTPMAPQEWLSLNMARSQPAFGKEVDYGRHVAAILSSTQAEFVRAGQAQLAENNRKLMEMANTIAKSAPTGAGNPFNVTLNGIKDSTGKSAAKQARAAVVEAA